MIPLQIRILKVTDTNRTGTGNQVYGFKDPDLPQNVTDPDGGTIMLHRSKSR